MTTTLPPPVLIKNAAVQYVQAGLSVIQTDPKTKSPVGTWKQYQTRPMNPRHIMQQAQTWQAMGIVCGAVSGNAEILDFDFRAAWFEPWRELVEAERPGLVGRLVLQRTQSDGLHEVYRVEGVTIPGNRKLAHDRIPVPGPGTHEHQGKPCTAEQEADGNWYIYPCMIETRGEGGMFLAAPSPGYELIHGDFAHVPTISREDWEVMIRAARMLDLKPGKLKQEPRQGNGSGDRPGDLYNQRNDVAWAILERAGWTKTGIVKGDREWLRRPGKDHGWSATLNGGNVLHVFSTNAAPFEAEKSYPNFAIKALVEHSGDFGEAASAIRHEQTRGRFQDVSGSGQDHGQEQPQREQSKAQEQPQAPEVDITAWRVSVAYQGEPEPRKYVVEGIVPMGQVTLFTSTGGVGKGWECAGTAKDVAADPTFPPASRFGAKVQEHGPAIAIFGEDDKTELHNRLKALGCLDQANLYVVPMPSVDGGPQPFFRANPINRELVVTRAWVSLCDQVRRIKPKLLEIDPLQIFCHLDLNIPEYAQFVCARLSALAAETGSAVIITHHFRKSKVTSPESAREAIRGTTGLVDGVRSVYALWVPDDDNSRGNPRALCRHLNIPYEPGCIVQGAVVKANGKANRNITTFLRNEAGYLEDITGRLMGVASNNLAEMLLEPIAQAAIEGRPYTKTGANGLWERRHELPDPFHMVSKHRFTTFADELLQTKKLVLAMGPGSNSVKWLDVPDGPFAQGLGEFQKGSFEGSDEEIF